MPNKKRISVLIVDDHTVFREGLATLFKNEGDIIVVGEATTGKEAVEQVASLSPQVVIMDLAMPVLNGFEAMIQIRAKKPGVKFVVLSAYCNAEYVDRCVSIGATGIISKENTYLLLTKAIREVIAGRTFYCPSTEEIKRKSKIGKVSAKDFGKSKLKNNLTARELQVLRLVAEGAANKQIASALVISVKTVEKHRQQLMDKLDIHDTARLTRYAIAAGLIENVADEKEKLI